MTSILQQRRMLPHAKGDERTRKLLEIAQTGEVVIFTPLHINGSLLTIHLIKKSFLTEAKELSSQLHFTITRLNGRKNLDFPVEIVAKNIPIDYLDSLIMRIDAMSEQELDTLLLSIEEDKTSNGATFTGIEFSDWELRYDFAPTGLGYSIKSLETLFLFKPNQYIYQGGKDLNGRMFVYDGHMKQFNLNSKAIREFFLSLGKLYHTQQLFTKLNDRQKIGLLTLRVDFNDFGGDFLSLSTPRGYAIQLAADYFKEMRVTDYLISMAKALKIENVILAASSAADSYFTKLSSENSALSEKMSEQDSPRLSALSSPSSTHLHEAAARTRNKEQKIPSYSQAPQILFASYDVQKPANLGPASAAAARNAASFKPKMASLQQLEFYELESKVWDDSIPNQEIVDEAVARVKRSEIKFYQLSNLLGRMKDASRLTIAKIKFDSPKVRAFLIKELTARVGSSSFYWSGTPEGSSEDFNSLAQDLGKVGGKASYPHLEERAINALVRLSLGSSAASERIKDIAIAFIDLPGLYEYARESQSYPRTGYPYAAELQAKLKLLVESIQKEEAAAQEINMYDPELHINLQLKPIDSKEVALGVFEQSATIEYQPIAVSNHIYYLSQVRHANVESAAAGDFQPSMTIKTADGGIVRENIPTGDLNAFMQDLSISTSLPIEAVSQAKL